MSRKSTARLDREINEALSRRSRSNASRRHHATQQVGADAWDVAMDAILEHNPKKAARIVQEIRETHGVMADPAPEFWRAVKEAPQDVRDRFYELSLQDEGGFYGLGRKAFQRGVGSLGGAYVYAMAAAGRLRRPLDETELDEVADGWEEEMRRLPASQQVEYFDDAARKRAVRSRHGS